MRAFCCLLLALALAACTGDGRERLVIYSPHGKDLLAHYEAAFEAAFPDVDVQWLDMGSQEAYERLRTERANPQASLWWGAPQMLFAQAAEEGLLAPFVPAWAEAVPPEARDPDGRWYGTYLTPEGILYNSDALAPADVPQDWDDLLDPRWQGRLLIRSPLASGTMRAIFGAMILRQPSVEEGYRWLARLDANTRAYTADPTQLYLRLARGEGALSLWNLPDAYLQAQENGYPFGFHMPAAGTPVLVDGIAIPAGAPNAARARQFVDFVTTPEALAEQAHRFHRIPARTDLDPDTLPRWMREAAFTPMPLDWDRLAREGNAWMQHWDERIKGRGAAYLAESAAR
ncbi:MAG: extracellular solute-binding protein [Rubricoccaceae bacterium]